MTIRSAESDHQTRFTFEPASQSRFDEYHAANPQVYALLRRFALEAKRSGRERLGIKALFERVRWYTDVEAKADSFKVNNNYTAFYARLLMEQEPELKDFFETRRSKADEAA